MYGSVRVATIYNTIDDGKIGAGPPIERAGSAALIVMVD
jgi:hypothetical protein